MDNATQTYIHQAQQLLERQDISIIRIVSSTLSHAIYTTDIYSQLAKLLGDNAHDVTIVFVLPTFLPKPEKDISIFEEIDDKLGYYLFEHYGTHEYQKKRIVYSMVCDLNANEVGYYTDKTVVVLSTGVALSTEIIRPLPKTEPDNE